jgi:amidase
MKGLDEIANLDAIGQAELVRKKKIKPLDLVDGAIQCIEKLNPTLNAVVTPMYEYARKQASAAVPEGLFAGVPFLLKDFLAEFAGVRFTEGTAFLRDYVPTEDSELVKRHKKAGLITIGKTNTPELALGATTEPLLFGPTHNPWDTRRTAGGSSGGSASAVAARIVPMAHGNDAGGSIRIPASCCGVFGLKPTRARNSLSPHYGDIFTGLWVEHALTLSVRDSAALLDATSGPALGDPYPAPPPVRPFFQEVGANPGKLRIAFTSLSPLRTDVHADCRNAVQDAAALCAELGHEVVEAAPAFNAEFLWQCFTTVLSAGFAWVIDDWGRRTGRTPTSEFFEPFVWAFRQRGNNISASEYLLALQDLQKLTRDISRFFINFDIWLTPTLGTPPVPLGTFKFSGEDPFELRRRMATFAPFTPISNVTGQPSMSVPLFWNGEGLPVGTHFMGRFGDEATLFRLAAQLEEARPWMKRRPLVSA